MTRSRAAIAWVSTAVLGAALAGMAVPRIAAAWTGARPIDPVAIRIGGVAVRWYGLLIVASFLPGWMLALPEMRRIGMSADESVDMLLVGIPLGLAGARLGFVVQDISYYARHPVEVLRTWQGGLSIHGVLAGVAIAVLLFSRWRRVRPGALFDVAAPSILLGQAVGRWGNFINQEAFGYPTGLPWGLYVPPGVRPPEWAGAAYFHPTFLYESLLDLAGLALLVTYRRRERRAPGQVAALYLATYSASRFVVEFLRIGTPIALGLTAAQWVSLVLGPIGLAWFARARSVPDRGVVVR